MIQPSDPTPARSQVGILIAIVVLSVAAGTAVVLLELLHAGDNTAIIIQIIGFFGVTVAALVLLLRTDHTSAQVRDLHMTVNGRLSELLETTRQLAHTAGVAEGQQLRRAADVPAAVEETKS